MKKLIIALFIVLLIACGGILQTRVKIVGSNPGAHIIYAIYATSPAEPIRSSEIRTYTVTDQELLDELTAHIGEVYDVDIENNTLPGATIISATSKR